jgi:hypothetical protein
MAVTTKIPDATGTVLRFRIIGNLSPSGAGALGENKHPS